MAHIVVDGDTHLRSVRLDDAPELFALVGANRAHLRRWLGWVDTTSPERIRQFLQAALDQDARALGPVCCIVHRGAIVGICGFKPVDRKNRSAELGYWLAASAAGRGIMTRCVQALINHGFRELDLHRIEARAATGNDRSRAVLERLGLRHEATLRETEWLNDRFVDQAVYSVLAHQWSPEPGRTADGANTAVER